MTPATLSHRPRSRTALILAFGVVLGAGGVIATQELRRALVCETCGPASGSAVSIGGAACPAHFEGTDIIVDDRAALTRVRLAMRDGVYALWTELGRAPTLDELGARLQLSPAETRALVDTLEACGASMRLGVRRVPESDFIAVAWPFANVPTGIRVTLDGKQPTSARCAVDSLGTSQLLGARATIETTLADTGASLSIVVDGERLVSASAPDAVVFDGGSCDDNVFLSSSAAVNAWKAQRGLAGGEVLPLSDAVKRGAELFGRITAGLPTAPFASVHASASAPTNAPHGPLAPWDPVDEAFRGCEGGCGARESGPSDGVIAQLGAEVRVAAVGQSVYCPVSGVVFTVSEQSAHRDVDGKRVWFCCEACAAYFSANAAMVRAARG